MTRGSAAALVALATLLAAGCAATHEPAPQVPCAAREQSPEVAICARDQAIRTLRARFRADVEAPGVSRSAEGVLVWRAPDALRIKLFTLGGLTVYDALWVGDATRVRGAVQQPLAARSESFDLGPGEVLDSPDADLALVLWSLWQPRCTAPPKPSSGAPGGYELDPRSARATAREVVVADGEVREEVLTRPRPDGGSEEIRVRNADYDCAQQPALPRHIEVEAPAAGWRAKVTIVDQARNVPLDDGLFALPGAASSRAGS